MNNFSKHRAELVVRDFSSPKLSINSFAASPGEGWCCIGSNLSGVDSFPDCLTAKLEPCSFTQMILPEQTGLLTFAGQQELFEEERRKDDTDHMNRLDPGTPASAFLTRPEDHGDLIAACNMEQSLHLGYRQLSFGQSRKLCLLAEATRDVSCLIIQNPYEGIDRQSCTDIDRMFAILLTRGIMLIITINNPADIPSWCTHIALIDKGRMTEQGLAEEVRGQVDALFAEPGSIVVNSEELREERQVNDAGSGLLVQLRNGFGGYGGERLFSGLELSIAPGQHTLVSGPNGCGKSTLLHMITGDHPWCYTNDLKVFGIQRGTGESIWDIKRQMGIVSSELHRNHNISGNCLQAVVSGLFDSIGLYQKPSPAQLHLAQKWLVRLGLQDMARRPFRQQSFAIQRLLLIARALIKVPRLLILDEPTQGLDQSNRNALLDLLEDIADEELCTLLYVSHRPDEYRPFFKQHVKMEKGPSES